MRSQLGLLAAAGLLAGAGCGGSGHQAAGAAGASSARPQTFGHGALASEATRTIEIRMIDSFRFDPAQVTVKRGEIVTFHLVNAGTRPHEFTIGGPKSQELHEDEMALMGMGDKSNMQGMNMSGMQGTASESVHVMPSEAKDLTWAFTGPEMPVFGCHIPGHWWGGMKGAFAAA